MTTDILVKCCRCKNQHRESERTLKRTKEFHGLNVSQLVCPRCGATSYFDMRPMVAYCWGDGLIEFGESIPDGAIELARGPKSEIKTFFEITARHGKGVSDGTLIVPGVPEAKTMSRRLGAVLEFIEWLGNAKNTRKRFTGIVLKMKES